MYTEEDDKTAEQEGEKFVARMMLGNQGEETPSAGTSAVPSRVVTPALLDSS